MAHPQNSYTAKTSSADLSFAAHIEEWYRLNGRDLPWRHTNDAYLIWLSEIILQQTRVEQGRDYWIRFTEHYPKVEDLANAPEDEVMRLWQGLGYYSRARNLHKAAKKAIADGHFPLSYDELLTLPGVGRYTAAAVASFAYNEPKAVVDGNVYRVLARHAGITTPIDSTSGIKEFAQLADMRLDQKNSALYNQAIMDFGALVCKPSSPNCSQCPVADTCIALATGRIASLPVKQHRTKLAHRYLTFVCIRNSEGKVLMQKRDKGDIYRGLYQFPAWESDAPLTFAQIEKKLPKGRLTVLQQGIQHRLTHRLLHIDFYVCELQQPTCTIEGLWMTANDVNSCALPRPLEEIWKILMSSNFAANR
ncbi:MAG: A/G-specific adenine glycosylase [Bacteroidaceae bacterium]